MIQTRSGSRILLGCILCLPLLGQAAAQAEPSVTAAVAAGKGAPSFVLPDNGGVRRSLADYRGHVVALFFFCGCDLCHQCARQWRQVATSGQLEQIAASGTKHLSGSDTTAAQGVVTLIVFGGDADGAREFARQTGLDPAKVVLLPDPLEVVSDLYVVNSCPRAFVIDGSGTIRYTNNEGKGGDRPVDLLVARTLDAIRACYPHAPSKPAQGSHANDR